MGDAFSGFDIPRVKRLANRLASGAPGAHRLHQDLADVLAAAQEDLNGAIPATTSHHLAPLVDASGGCTPASGLPGSLQHELHDTAASARRRVAQLEGMEKLAHAGFPVSGDDVFLDEKPPDAKKIREALAKVRRGEHDHSALAGESIFDAMKGLTGGELDLVISRLSDQDLKAIDGAVQPDGHLNPGIRMKIANLMLGAASAHNLARLLQHMPHLAPAIDDPTLHYADRPGSLYGKNGIDIGHDIAQGKADDCWYLAGLGAVADRNPAFIRQHIKTNANGTYDVTLYQDGKPVHVTVDGRTPVYTVPQHGIPTDFDGNARVKNGVQWPAIYEKALAQLHGGYGNLHAARGADGMAAVTGHTVKDTSPSDHSLDDVARMLADRHAVTTGSKRGGLFGTGLFGPDRWDGGKVDTAHEYIVKSVDRHGHPPTITLVNPQGRQPEEIAKHLAPPTVTLTEAQWHDYFDELSSTAGGV